jgi:hypothetical protein
MCILSILPAVVLFARVALVRRSLSSGTSLPVKPVNIKTHEFYFGAKTHSVLKADLAVGVASAVALTTVTLPSGFTSKASQDNEVSAAETLTIDNEKRATKTTWIGAVINTKPGIVRTTGGRSLSLHSCSIDCRGYLGVSIALGCLQVRTGINCSFRTRVGRAARYLLFSSEDPLPDTGLIAEANLRSSDTNRTLLLGDAVVSKSQACGPTYRRQRHPCYCLESI